MTQNQFCIYIHMVVTVCCKSYLIFIQTKVKHVSEFVWTEGKRKCHNSEYKTIIDLQTFC